MRLVDAAIPCAARTGRRAAVPFADGMTGETTNAKIRRGSIKEHLIETRIVFLKADEPHAKTPRRKEKRRVFSLRLGVFA
jgi:hypothetical protein